MEGGMDRPHLPSAIPDAVDCVLHTCTLDLHFILVVTWSTQCHGLRSAMVYASTMAYALWQFPPTLDLLADNDLLVSISNMVGKHLGLKRHHQLNMVQGSARFLGE